MKIRIEVSCLAVAALCGVLQPTFAQQPSAFEDVHSRIATRNNNNNLPALGKLEKANKIIGMEIKNSQDQKLGDVKDLVVDLRNGRIVEVIVGRGGILGVDEKYTAVPPGQLTCIPDKRVLQLNVDENRFKEAPTFKLSEWDSNVQGQDVAGVYKYYDTVPYFQTGSSHEPVVNNKTTPDNRYAATGRLGRVDRASQIVGAVVRNKQDERIGKVEDLMVDLPGGRVADVVLESGGYLGIGEQYSAVPPQSLQPGAEKDTLMLDTSREALAAAPHFNSSQWEWANDPVNVATVYRSYHVQPYFSTGADNTAQNLRDRNENSLTPFRQGSSSADIDSTRQIRKAVMAANDLSTDARNIKIITLNGHVTLRGPVKNEDEKRRIQEIAKTAMPSAGIDNQLQVESGPTANSTPDNQKQ